MSVSTHPLRLDGKPMRALRALAQADQPLTEEQVYNEAKRSYFDASMWHGPLRTLIERGLVERSGSRGGYRYEITEAGRKEIA